MSVEPALLDRLVCPLTRGPLRLDEATRELVSEAAGLAFPIRDGVPVTLADEVRPVSPSGTQSVDTD